MSKVLERFILENEDEISKIYSEKYFEHHSGGGDIDPLDNKYFDENLYLDVAQDLWYDMFGGNK